MVIFGFAEVVIALALWWVRKKRGHLFHAVSRSLTTFGMTAMGISRCVLFGASKGPGAVTAPFDAEPTSRAYFASTPVVTRGAMRLGSRDARSASTSNRRVATSMR